MPTYSVLLYRNTVLRTVLRYDSRVILNEAIAFEGESRAVQHNSRNPENCHCPNCLIHSPTGNNWVRQIHKMIMRIAAALRFELHNLYITIHSFSLNSYNNLFS